MKKNTWVVTKKSCMILESRKCFLVWLILDLKKNQVKDSASCKIEIKCNSFPFTIWKYMQKRTCFLVWLKKVYGLKNNQLRDSASREIEIQCNNFPIYYLEV